MNDGANDVSNLDLSGVQWRASSEATPGTGAEVAEVTDRGGHTRYIVRNARQPDGPFLVYTPDEWHAFTGGVRNGDFDGI